MASVDAIAALSERVAKLEEASQTDITTRVATLEANSRYAANKEDIANIKVDIAELKATMIRWFVVTTIGIIAVLVAALQYFLG